MTCSETMDFRIATLGQQYVLQECRKNNRKNDFDQYLPKNLAALLHDSCRNVVGVYSCGAEILVDLNSKLC